MMRYIGTLSTLSLAAMGVNAYGTPHTSVVELTTSNFQTMLEDPANGLFLLKFYAPWCGHCKKLAPILDEVAPKVAGKMAIGKIDCTTSKPLCTEYKIKAFPTLQFYKDGTFYPYPGGRKAHEIINFAKKMSQPAVEKIKTYDAALELATQSDTSVAFVLYDKAMVGANLQDQLQSSLTGQVFHQVARKQQALASFVVLEASAEGEEGALSSPIPGQTNLPDSFIIKVEKNLDPLFWDVEEQFQTSVKLMQFVKENNVPLVSSLGPSNFKKIGHIGRQLVIGCVDGSDKAQVEAMQEQLSNYAKTGPKAITSQYYFGWMDGKLWQNFLKQFQVKTLPQIFVLHVPTRGYFQNETFGEDSVQAFLEAIDAGLLTSRDTSTNRGWKGMTDNAQNMFFQYLPWSLLAVIASICVILIIIIPPAEELRPPYNNRPAEQPEEDEATQTDAFEEEEDDDGDHQADESKKDK